MPESFKAESRRSALRREEGEMIRAVLGFLFGAGLVAVVLGCAWIMATGLDAAIRRFGFDAVLLTGFIVGGGVVGVICALAEPDEGGEKR